MFSDLKILGLLIRAALFVWGLIKKRHAEEALAQPLKDENQARIDNEKLLNAKPGDGTAAWRGSVSKDDTH